MNAIPLLPFNFCHCQASAGFSDRFTVEEEFLLDVLTITGIIDRTWACRW